VVASGGAVVVADSEFDTDRLEQELGRLLADPVRLATMAAAMRGAATVDAAEKAAAVVMEAAGG
jgi:UDP-N-acetylglucosamine--N-acetylmuramyl-(pentapeptide) pyrophosphoryl-undecaprenol N-acetylglucosamine transferase